MIRVRLAAMNRALRRFDRTAERADDHSKILRITAQAAERLIVVGHATAGGDERRLRGIPAIGRGVQGAINGTRP